MSSTAEALQQATAQVATAKAKADEQRTEEAAFRRELQDKKARLEGLEANYRAYRTALALNEQPNVTQPSASEMEDLRTDLQVGDGIANVFAQRTQAAESAVDRAEGAQRAAHLNHARETALSPALEGVAKAFEQLSDAAVELMAAHFVVYRKLDDRPITPNSFEDFHGPMAHFLKAIQTINWENYPYSIRPRWLPLHGAFFPGSWGGADERAAELLAAAEQVPS